MNILLLEDEKVISQAIAEFLKENFYRVFVAHSGEDALTIFHQHSIDLAVLDILLPGLSGLDVLKEIRKVSDIPVIILTALNDEKLEIESFDLLVDDYMNKPFSLLVLKKRIDSLLRRYYQNHKIWSYGDVRVDFTSYSATYKSKPVPIKNKELQVLKALLDHANQVLTRDQIMDLVWKQEATPYNRVIDVYIKNLRKKLQLDCIVTIKNVGYKLVLQCLETSSWK